MDNDTTHAAVTITPDMIHEMEAHLPFDQCKPPPVRWQWMADFLNRALAHPGVPCPCCGVAPNGEIYDHLTPEQWKVMQPTAEKTT